MNQRIEVKYTAGPNSGVKEHRFLDPSTGYLHTSLDRSTRALSDTFKQTGAGVWQSDASTVVDVLYLCGCGAKPVQDCPATCTHPHAQAFRNLHEPGQQYTALAELSTEAKRDTGKPRFDLLEDGCPDALLDVVKVMTWAVEVKGYRAHSWKEVPEARRRYRAAMSRHRNALARGELLDDESGLPHEAHIACNAIFLAQLLYVQPE